MTFRGGSNNYLITIDDPSSIERNEVIDIDQTVKDIQRAWNGKVDIISYNCLLEQCCLRAMEYSQRDESMTVSLFPVPYPWNFTSVRIKRLVDANGGVSRIHGLDELGRLAHIIKQTNEVDNKTKKVQLIDDGAHSGVTICSVLRYLSRHEINVNRLILGVVPFKTRVYLQHEFPDIEVVIVDREYDFVDWTSTSDFSPLSDTGGRLMDGSLRRIPYLVPFVNPSTWSRWTGLDKRNAIKFSYRRLLETLINTKDDQYSDVTTLSYLVNGIRVGCSDLEVTTLRAVSNAVGILERDYADELKDQDTTGY